MVSTIQFQRQLDPNLARALPQFPLAASVSHQEQEHELKAARPTVVVGGKKRERSKHALEAKKVVVRQ